jgi:Na+/H+ antiporter NhaD/arsenite permease-like protein
VCIALGPVVIRLAQRVRRSPLPYLVALATSANVGFVGTITGNPQNMIIGTLSKISYASFGARLGPVAAIGLVLNFVVVAAGVPPHARRGDPRRGTDEHCAEGSTR